MTNFDSTKHPRGHTSNPGSFSEKQHSDAEVNLAAEPDWGDTGVHQGSRTPWGAADIASNPVPGVTVVHTAGHGGIKLSPERNKQIPTALRNRNGWYEEDTESSIVGMFHPEAFPHIDKPGYFSERVRDWHPGEWEAATGQTIEPGQSYMRDSHSWAAAHKDDFIVTSVRDNPDDLDSHLIIARRGDERVEVIVPRSEYNSRSQPDTELGQQGRTLIDVSKFQVVPPAPSPAQVPSKRFGGVSEPATPAARERLAKDLNSRWRRKDGSVLTLQQMLETEGFSGKSSSVDNNGKRTYFLQQMAFESDSSYAVIPVSKATFDAAQAPDTRTPAAVASQARDVAQAAFDRTYAPAERRKALEKLKAAEQKYMDALQRPTEN